TMIGNYFDSASSVVHHGFAISELIEVGEINKYLKTNSGFFHFMKEPSKKFFKECKQTYEELFLNKSINKSGFLGDEIAIGMVGHKCGIRVFKSPSPMMWEKDLAILKENDDTYPMCHFISIVPPATVKWFEKRAEYRRRLSGVPTGGEKVWK